MRKQFYVVLIVALTAIIGCKKEDTTTNKPTTGGGSEKVLKRIIETENGVNKTYNFTYDGQKRLASIATSNNSEVTTFTYDSDNNVVKIENKVDDVKNVYEFTYNNKLPVSGLFKSYEMNGNQQGDLVLSYRLNYTVTNGLVSKIKMIMGSGAETVEMDFTLSYTNNNLTKVESQGFAGYTATFTYGTKKPIFPPMFKYILDQAGFSLQFFAKNELLSMSYDFPGTENDVTVNTQYTYDANGYVLTANDGETTSKFEYE